MPNITTEQFEHLQFVFDWDEEIFPKLLEEYTGLEAKLVPMFQIFDGGDYVGNTHNDTINDILRKAGIEVVEDGK